MRLFPFLQKDNLQPVWQYKTKGVIWRIVPTKSGRIAGEERDLTNKTVSFFCLNLTTGEVQWERLNYGEQWWMSIEAASETRVFLHRFATPDLPQHRGIVAVDIASGRSVWSRDDITFFQLGVTSLLAYKDSLEGKEVLELDTDTGEIIRSLGSSDPSELPEAGVSDNPGEDEIELPVPVHDFSSEYTALSEAARAHISLERHTGPAEVVDRKDVAILSFHEQDNSGKSLNTILVIVDKAQGRVLFRDMLNAGVPVAVPESFFVRRDMVYFIKERRLLVAVQIPGVDSKG